MRRSLATVVLVALIVATPIAAAPVDLDQAGPTVVGRVLEVVTGWIEKLGVVKSDPDDDKEDGGPPLDEFGSDWSPSG